MAKSFIRLFQKESYFQKRIKSKILHLISALRDLTKSVFRIFSGYIRVMSKLFGLRKSNIEQDAAYLPKQMIYKKAEDDRFRRLAHETSVLNKPFSGLNIVSFQLYRLGLAFSALNLGPHDEILDFGAGTCWLSAWLNRMGVKTVSLDISPAALELGRKVFSLDKRQRWDLEPEFHTYDGHTLPFADERFSAIISFDAFHHIPNQEEILREMYRVLNKTGRVVFCEPLGEHQSCPSSRIEMECYGLLERDIDLSNLERMALDVGFEQLVVKPYSRTPDEEFGRNKLRTNVLCSLEQAAQRYLGNIPVFYLKKTAINIFDSNHPNKLAAKIDLASSKMKSATGDKCRISITLTNCGDTLWLSAHNRLGGFVQLGCQLLDHDKKVIDRDYRRFLLTGDIEPGSSCSQEIEIETPPKPGKYFLKFDLVDEQICWFEEVGSDPALLEIDVT